jgi:hypothetical protein
MNRNIGEPSLAELIADPLIGLAMKSDGVERAHLEVLFERVARERGCNLCSSPHQEAAPCTVC